jgi:hypothetical protein
LAASLLSSGWLPPHRDDEEDLTEDDWVVAQWCFGNHELFVGQFVEHLHEGTSVIRILNGQDAPVNRSSLRRIANQNLDKLRKADDG